MLTTTNPWNIGKLAILMVANPWIFPTLYASDIPCDEKLSCAYRAEGDHAMSDIDWMQSLDVEHLMADELISRVRVMLSHRTHTMSSKTLQHQWQQVHQMYAHLAPHLTESLNRDLICQVRALLNVYFPYKPPCGTKNQCHHNATAFPGIVSEKPIALFGLLLQCYLQSLPPHTI